MFCYGKLGTRHTYLCYHQVFGAGLFRVDRLLSVFLYPPLLLSDLSARSSNSVNMTIYVICSLSFFLLVHLFLVLLLVAFLISNAGCLFFTFLY